MVAILPMVIPAYEFTFRFETLMAGFEEALVLASVTEITRTTDHYEIRTHSTGSFAADNVVVATPIEVASLLLDLGETKSPIRGHTYRLRGALRQPWARVGFSLFPDSSDTCSIAQQNDGSILLLSVSEDPDFARYFSDWEVVEHLHWKPAFHLGGFALLECEQGAGLYLIGDHNVCTLEDAFITGIHAANRILART